MEKPKIVKMGYVIQDYLISKSLNNVKPKELMDMLIQKGFFKKDNREGLPLRDVLRQLDTDNLLYLLPQVSVDRKEINRFWFFNPIDV